MPEASVAILPYEHRQGAGMADTALDALVWPLGRPERLSTGSLRDLGPQDHLLLYPRTRTHWDRRAGIRARISLIMGEPAVIHAKHHRLLRLTWRRFYRILTFNESLLARIPNGVFFPYGTTWVPDWRDLSLDKTRMVSLIASAKRDTEGHRLRHSVADRVRADAQPVDLMGGGYHPFDRKSDGLAPYRYSVVIENVRERNYFSEKLVDAVLCSTVPIYWGCPNIDRFIDPDGIILCNSQADIHRAIAAASAQDYAARLPRITRLKPPLEAYCDLERRAAQAVLESLRPAA